MRTSEGLSVRQKKLLFHAWHRGTREMDLVLGSFVDARLADLSATQMDQLEKLMEVADPELFKWITGEAEIPQHHQSDIYNDLIAWYQKNRATP